MWASQHYLSEPFTYFQPIPTLARIAAEARGMTLGTGVLLLPLHHPVDIAEQLATLDVISDGRLIFGAGLGYRDAENVAMGHDPKERVGRLVEGLEVVERLWSGEPTTYEGRHFSVRAVRISMRPTPEPAPADLARGQRRRRRQARRAPRGRVADESPRHARDTRAPARALPRARGASSVVRRPPRPRSSRSATWRPTAATAVSEAAEFLAAKYSAYRRWEQDKALPAGESFDASFEELARDRFILGDPVRVAEEIARYRERLGVTTMIFRVQWPGMDQERVLRSIRLLGHKVLLKFLSS